LYTIEGMTAKPVEQNVRIPVDAVQLQGTLALPVKPRGAVVLFAHGSGSSRFSPRNNAVANVLRASGLGTLLFDLLTEDEDAVYETRFDINLLANRLVSVTRWFMDRLQTRGLSLGYFGASTGAAAALQAAAEVGSAVGAVVSRGGRPDLAGPFLHRVLAPTLLIVGGEDIPVIELNRLAYDRLTSVKELVIVPGATHLFEEPGTLEEVARLTAAWFTRYLRPEQASSRDRSTTR